MLSLLIFLQMPWKLFEHIAINLNGTHVFKIVDSSMKLLF